MLREEIVQPVPDDLADDDGHDRREVKEPDLRQAETVQRL